MDLSRRILCLAPSWLGDAVLSLPAIAMLRDAGAQVEVLARAGIARVYTNCLEAAAVYETSNRSRWRRWRDAWRLRGRHYDATLILAPSFSGAVMGWASGSAVRLGERGDGRDLLLTHRLARSSRDVHLSRSYAALAAATLTGLSMPVPPLRQRFDAPPFLEAHAQERQAAAALLRRRGVSEEEKFLVVAPGARYGPAKRYPPERFAAAAARLCRERRATLLLVGSAADRAETAAVRTHLPEAVDLAGETSMGDLLGVLAAAQGVLSNDSGIMHLAAALGVPVVAVFGSTHPAWTAPMGRRARVVQHRVPCAPCYRKRCPIDFPCMLGVAPERLVEAMRALLGADGAGRPESAARL